MMDKYGSFLKCQSGYQLIRRRMLKLYDKKSIGLIVFSFQWDDQILRTTLDKVLKF